MNISLNRRLALPGILAVAAIALATFSLPAFADDIKFKLSGDMEVPPVATKASGEGMITIKPDMSVSGKVMTSGLTATMAHIHIGKAGANGPVVITLSKSGDNGWMVPEGSKLSADQYQAYKAGELYVNVHSAEYKPGEIRGQLMPPMAPKSSY
ncbi:CHRD domain-containing protein [Dechloromonas sp.]|uniref:CHRD domain-containing protein n=1 Tax=Dechloromonas sp. TaxID=1917218 RepID=UPI00286EAEF0|nr:CHRD domain-containing protein [Dechloromonas sp.]